MNGSLILFGGNKNNREKKIIEIINREEGKAFEKISDLKDKPDIHVIDLEEKERSISIAQARKGVGFLREKPFSYKKKFLIILNSEKMTTQAQNSLLKTLEEPPVYALIILSSKTQNSLLETIVSRCKLVSIKGERSDEEENYEISYKKILNMSMGERLDVCLEISKEEKDDVLKILDSWVEEGRTVLLKKPRDISQANNLKRIIEVKSDLENTNVNVRLSLEALVLSLSREA